MGKRLGILGAVIAVVALAVGAVSPALGSSSQGSASTSSGHADNQQTIRVTAVFTEFDPNIDVGAPGFSLGDEVVFSGNLLRNGEQVGRIGVVCTFVSTANADRVEAQCPTTSILPGGQITTQGTIVNRSLNFTLPITGGSGQFQGAGGQVVSRDVSTPTQPQVELSWSLEAASAFPPWLAEPRRSTLQTTDCGAVVTIGLSRTVVLPRRRLS